jgi:DNA polymerase-1
MSEICTKCNLYKSSHIDGGLSTLNCLKGKGTVNANIMFVDASPKEEEVRTKIPFSGQSGMLLKKIISSVGIKETYFTYLNKCSLGYNQQPTVAEIAACFPYLEEEISLVKPKVIVLLGNIALPSFGIKEKITKARGIPVYSEKYSCWIVPTYSPAFLQNFTETSYQHSEFRTDLSKALKIALEGMSTEKSSVNYKIASTIAEAEWIEKQLLQVDWFSADTENDSLDTFIGKNLINSFSLQENTGFVIPYLHPKGFDTEQGQKEVLKILQRIYASDVKKIFQNGKYDTRLLKSNNMPVKKYAFDTLLAHALLDENSSHGLDSIVPIFTDMGDYKDDVSKYFKGEIQILNPGILSENNRYWKFLTPEEILLPKIQEGLKKKLSSLKKIGDNVKQQVYMSEAFRKSTIYDCPYDQLTWYAAQDADATFRLFKKFYQLLQEENMLALLVEMVKLSTTLADMETTGIGVDIAYVREQATIFNKKVEDADRKVVESKEVKLFMQKYQVPGNEFNTASPDQVAKLLYEEIGLIPPKYNKLTPTQKAAGQKKGTASVDAESLRKLLETNKLKILEDLLAITEVAKTSEYFNEYLKLATSSIDGRIHTNFNQVKTDDGGTITGRLSSSSPNLQNIPSKTNPEKAKLLRRSFIARPGYSFISADFSQIEFRIWAVESKDPGLIKYINEDRDIHRETAAITRKITPEQVPEDVRDNAKRTVFGTLYGQMPYTTAKKLGLEEYEVTAFLDGFYRLFPVANDYLDHIDQLHNKQGYLINVFGRKRRILELYSKDKVVYSAGFRKARNFPLASGAADLCFKVMNLLHRNYAQYGEDVKLLVQVHDELITECKDELIPIILPLKERIMTTSVTNWPIKLKVSSKVGKNLADLKKWEQPKG